MEHEEYLRRNLVHALSLGVVANTSARASRQSPVMIWTVMSTNPRPFECADRSSA